MIDITKGYLERGQMIAGDLRGAHIGAVVLFAYRSQPGLIATVVMGELRQIAHCASSVDIALQAHDSDTGATLEEFNLDPDDEIMLMEKR